MTDILRTPRRAALAAIAVLVAAASLVSFAESYHGTAIWSSSQARCPARPPGIRRIDQGQGHRVPWPTGERIWAPRLADRPALGHAILTDRPSLQEDDLDGHPTWSRERLAA